MKISARNTKVVLEVLYQNKNCKRRQPYWQSIIIIIIIIMALQPFVGTWPLFEFLDPIHSRYDSLDAGSTHRKASICTQKNTNTE
jgi:hypothetical protein